MSGILIRKACPEDAEGIWRLNETFNGEGTNEVENVRKALERSGQEMIFLAEQAGQAIGFCCMQVLNSVCYPAPCAELTELYVDEAHRRQGIATALVRHAEEACRSERDVDEIHLLTGEDNLGAQAFYRSLGYERKDEMFFSRVI